MDNGWALLFDLDQTMVITSPIEKLRKARQWPTVYSSFNMTYLPPETLEFIRKTKAIGIMGIVTISPRPYAEKLTKYHKINLPILVAYHDVNRIKPDPECLIKASKKLAIELDHCIYVGDKVEDLLTGQSAGCHPIGITWDGSLESKAAQKITENIFTNWNDVYLSIKQIIGQGD
jgi:HAD superfamily hydrolase (TIGR01549 family)